MLYIKAALTTVIVYLAASSLSGAELPADRFEQLDAYLVSEAPRFRLPGLAVAVTSDGEIVHEKIQGEGLQRDSAFLIGSCAKTITALATLIALDEAGVDVQATVRSILPRLRVRGEDEPLRIVHLLQHRSGLLRSQGFDDLPSLDALDRIGHTIHLRHPPGEKFAYCNLNYGILGLIVEQVTGMPFAEFVQLRVFSPAGMSSSSCGNENAGVALAPEHQYFFGVARRVSPTTVPAHQVPSGFMWCSARDLAQLQILLAQNGTLDGEQVFPKKMIQRMKTPPGDSGFGYGMGLYHGNHHFGPLIAHEGATPTAYAFHGQLPQDGFGFVLLTNVNLFDPFTDHGEAIYENIFRILQGEAPHATYPIRIWVRWLVLIAVLITGWRLSALVLRWRKTGWSCQFPGSTNEWMSIAAQVLLPIVVWYAVLHWTETPLITVFQLEPDLMWSFAFLTVTGMVTGCLKKFIDPNVIAPDKSAVE